MLPKSKAFHTKNWKFTFWLKAHHSFDHLEASFNLWGHGSGVLVLACPNGQKTAIPNTSIDTLFQEISKAIELGCCASTEAACLTCCGKYFTNLSWSLSRAQKRTWPVLLMQLRSWVRPNNVPELCIACFLSSAKGDPIITQSWFIAHWPIGLSPWLNERR